jgi:translation initiation factor 1 (eIF-1/SUI1)
MATTVYEASTIELMDGREIYDVPLKIRYLREFMDAFDLIKQANNDQESILCLTHCARLAMKQYAPSIKTSEEFEEIVNLPIVYKILKYAGGINVDKDSEKPVKEQAEDSKNSWKDLDLAELESEAFLLGIWKDYSELENSLSMPELTSILTAKREKDYQEKKFLAAIQGIDIEKNKKSNAWEEMKARVFSGGKATDSRDVLALQGVNAKKAGFGIGMGLGYTNAQNGEQPFGKKQ